MHRRNDIDGMRAIAVFFVLFHHFELYFDGGYIGVDIFFVISGFVITQAYYQKAVLGEFSIRQFLTRRYYRLMPALVFMLLATNLAFSIIMTPSDLVNLYKHTISNFFYLSNIYSFLEYGNYFGLNVKEAPLLHTWSLSVEWQFYIIFPFVIVALYKLNLLDKIRFLIISLIVLVVASTFVSQYIATYYPKSGYYLLFSRVHELVLGCLVFILKAEFNGIHKNWLLKDFLGIFSMFLIFYPAICYNPMIKYPGFNSIMPVLGTAIFIFIESSVVNKILSNKVFSYFGVCSYSIYLWHWPIVVFLNYQLFHGDIYKFISIFIVIFVSIFTCKYVEFSLLKRKYV